MHPMRRPPRRVRKPATLFGLGLLLLPLAGGANVPEIDPDRHGDAAAAAARLMRVQLPDSMVVGSTKVGLVVFDAPVPSDMQVSLRSSDASVWSAPSEVVVLRGRRHRAFGVRPQRVGCANVTATHDRVLRTDVMMVHEAPNSTIRLEFPTQISPVPGQRSTGYVVLSSSGGMARISLSSNNTSVATVPSSVTGRLGQTRIPFTITTGSTASHPGCAVIRASIPGTARTTTSATRPVRQFQLGG